MMHRSYGLCQVRLTGGEPLAYTGIVSLVAAMREAMPDLAIVMTTNGAGLDRVAGPLREAGLDRLNLSLDSTDADTYRRITGGDVKRPLAALAAAREAGFPPPKINTVVLRGLNDGQLPQMAEWAIENGLEIRFLEAMPIGPAARHNRERFVSASQMLARLRRSFGIEPIVGTRRTTARRYRVTRGSRQGVVGIIPPMSDPFCGGCGRVRLSAEGILYPCLLDSRHVDMSAVWRRGGFDAETAAALVEEAVAGKQRDGPQQQATAMVQIGG
jgi:cyclic pyranopterin phosphate synthase